MFCFGAEAGEYRVEAYPDYHAARPPMPDLLEWQWNRAPALYEALGWSVADTEELEADDLLGSFAEVETEAGGTTLILTGDRDMFQCASDSVTVLLQRTGGEGPEEVGPDVVREKYGIDPEQVPDFIALRGDPSDGLPGAKGIGAKTAADLLRRKGDLEHVILGAIREKPSVRRALIEQADELRAFKDIATLRTIPLERPPDAPTDFAGRGGGGERVRDGPPFHPARGDGAVLRIHAIQTGTVAIRPRQRVGADGPLRVLKTLTDSEWTSRSRSSPG